MSIIITKTFFQGVITVLKGPAKICERLAFARYLDLNENSGSHEVVLRQLNVSHEGPRDVLIKRFN
jgi:hypothetical protein